MKAHNVFLKEQLNYILNRAFEETFPALKARTFIPVNRSVPPAAESVSAKIWDQYGRASVMNTAADTFPSVSLGQREAFSTIKSLGVYFEYSLLDIRRSQIAGTQLDSKLAVAARQTIETKLDELAATGDDKIDMKGLVGRTDIYKETLKPWFLDKPKKALDIVTDINKLVSHIAQDTHNGLLPDTLLLPVKHFAHIAQQPMTENSSVTVLQYILNNNPYIKNIDSWVHLTDTCIVYPRTPNALEMYIPLEFEMLPPQARAMNMRVYCHARFGGVHIYTPKACAYGVGI